MSLPKNSLTLYIHALQSIVWNHMVSYRLRTYGTTPIFGDFVGSIQADAPLEKAELDENLDEPSNELDSGDLIEEERNWSTCVIKAEADLGRYSIFDVVLPLPGEMVEYPAYLKPIYEKTCKELCGLSLSDFKCSNSKVGEIKGAYRAICSRVSDLAWKIVPNVSDPNKPLLASDLDRLLKRPVCEIDTTEVVGKPQDSSNGLGSLDTGGQETEAGKGCVLLSCTLSKSSYLTVTLRELMSEELESS